MGTTYVYALASVSLIGLISLCGVFAIPVTRQTLAKVTFILVSLATGAMLGNAFVHLLPEAFESAHEGKLTDMSVSLLVVGGFLFCFLVEKVMKLSCHHGAGHHHLDQGCHGDHCHDEEEKGLKDIHPTGLMSIVSHAMDNFTDGVLIGGTYLISIPAGIATTIAVVLHEIPMEFGSFGVLVQSGMSRKRAILVNFCSALVAVAGTTLVLVFGSVVDSVSTWLTPLGAGIVLYVTAAGLIPRLQLETNSKRSLVSVLIMLAGLGVMVAVKFFE